MRLVWTVLLALLVLALGAAAGVLWLDVRHLRDSETAAAEAMAAARAVAPGLLSYDYRTVEQDLARAREHTTGPLAAQYAELAGSLATRARQRKAVQTASVVAAAVERAEPGRVVVLLFVNTGTVRQLTGQAEPQQQVTRNRARMIMVERGDRWLASDLSTLLGTA